MSEQKNAQTLEVETRDGYKGGEKPRKILLNGKEYLVQEVLETSRVRRADNEGDEEHFKVMLDVYGEAKVVYHHSWDGWTLEDKKEKKTFGDIFVGNG